jgi:hypothetical protein
VAPSKFGQRRPLDDPHIPYIMYGMPADIKSA